MAIAPGAEQRSLHSALWRSYRPSANKSMPSYQQLQLLCCAAACARSGAQLATPFFWPCLQGRLVCVLHLRHARATTRNLNLNRTCKCKCKCLPSRIDCSDTSSYRMVPDADAASHAQASLCGRRARATSCCGAPCPTPDARRPVPGALRPVPVPWCADVPDAGGGSRHAHGPHARGAGIKTMIVSDPASEKAAAAVCVEVRCSF